MIPRHILIDTDPGIDDALAILLALASPELVVDGITVVHGNTPAAQGTVNALSVLELASAAHIPVHKGCELPLVQPSLLAPETHGDRGLGYAELPQPQARPRGQHASEFIIDQVRSKPGEITLAAIGPLTNIALAIRLEPRIVQDVKEILVMGGSLLHPGNTTPAAEFNTFVDPHAAHIVFHSGMPVTLIPLDVTYECILKQADVDRLLRVDSPVTRFIAEATRFYMEFHDEYQQIDGCVINDPLALALAFMPEVCDYRELHVDVDLSGGPSMGGTFADFYRLTKKPANLRAALGVRPREFIEAFLVRIEALAAAVS